MTVKELIERLNQFEEDAIILINDDGWLETPNYVDDHDGEIVIQIIN